MATRYSNLGIRLLAFACLLAIVAAAALAATASGAAQRTYTVHMAGANETPRNGSHATGTASFTIAGNGKSIRYRLTAHGLHGTPAAAHIHLGRAGAPGGIIIGLKLRPFRLPASGVVTKKSFVATGNVKTFAQAIRAIRAGRTYVNVHTTKYPAGEIRGQIR